MNVEQPLPEEAGGPAPQKAGVKHYKESARETDRL